MVSSAKDEPAHQAQHVRLQNVAGGVLAGTHHDRDAVPVRDPVMMDVTAEDADTLRPFEASPRSGRCRRRRWFASEPSRGRLRVPADGGKR